MRMIIFSVLVLCAIAIPAAYFYVQPMTKEVEKFCASIMLGKPFDSVYRDAKKRGLIIPFYANTEDSLLVFNYSGPLFRVGCEVKFSRGYVSSKEIFRD